MLKENKFWIFFIVGLVLKALVSAISYHPDTQALEMVATIINEHHLWFKMYDYIPNLPSSDIIYQYYGPKVMNYPPMAYWFQAIWYKFTYFLTPHNLNQYFILSTAPPLSNWKFNWLLFIFKLKYLIFDIAIAYLIYKISKNKLYLLIWWLNPFTLYATYMIGQFDIIPLFFSLLAYYLAVQQKYFQAAFWLGVGGAFKIFPLLFLPFVALRFKTFKSQFLALLEGLIVYLAPTVPFLLSPGFRAYALLAPQTEKIFHTKIMLTGNQYISIFLLLYVGLFIWNYFKQTSLLFSFFTVLAVFFSFVHFHPQWIIFIVPWIILYLPQLEGKEKTKFINLMIFLTFLYFLIILSFDPFLNFNLFSPLLGYPLISNGNPPLQIIENLYSPSDLISLIRTVWAGTLLTLIPFLSHIKLKSNYV